MTLVHIFPPHPRYYTCHPEYSKLVEDKIPVAKYEYESLAVPHSGRILTVQLNEKVAKMALPVFIK